MILLTRLRTRIAIRAAVFVQIVLHCVGAGAQTSAGGWRASAMLASDYVQYGLSQQSDTPAVGFTVDFESAFGAFAGLAATSVEYAAERRFARPRDSQLTLYSGYVWRERNWTTSLTLARYLYPDIVRSYDYSSLSATASFRDRIFVTAGETTDYLGVYDGARYLRVGVARPWLWNLRFEASAGVFRSGGEYGTSYRFQDIGVTRPFGRLAADLRFHANDHNRSSLYGNGEDDLWVLSLTWSLLAGGSGAQD